MGASFHFCETEYRFSHLLSDDEIQINGAFTYLPVRRNNSYKEVDNTALELVKTWKKIIADGTTDGFHGAENGISGNFDSLVLPGAKPERLKHSIWLTQFFFLLDGMCLSNETKFLSYLLTILSFRQGRGIGPRDCKHSLLLS